MRELANITHDGPKWIVLDGDIDPMWIESLNTVMDDNKVRAQEHGEKFIQNSLSFSSLLCLGQGQWPPAAIFYYMIT